MGDDYNTSKMSGELRQAGHAMSEIMEGIGEMVWLSREYNADPNSTAVLEHEWGRAYNQVYEAVERFQEHYRSAEVSASNTPELRILEQYHDTVVDTLPYLFTGLQTYYCAVNEDDDTQIKLGDLDGVYF